MEPITNTQDIIDSRDIIKRIEELEGFFDTCQHCGEGQDIELAEKTNKCSDCEQELLEDLEIEELADLQDVFNQAEGCGAFNHGESLIHESYFVEYCEELCCDIGDIPGDLPWYIASNIEWDGVANDIKADYMEINLGGASYFMRAYGENQHNEINHKELK